MAESYLEKLEQAYLELSVIGNEEVREERLSQLEKEDAVLGSELRQLFEITNPSQGGLNITAGFFSLESEEDFKNENGNDAFEELVSLLKNVCPSQKPDVLGELEGFELKSLAGVGPLGFVFQGWDPVLKRKVAIKVLTPSIAGDPKKKALFVDEARLASSIRSVNVATIFYVHCSKNPDLAFFVMEWIEGDTLQDWINADSRNDAGNHDRAADYLVQLVSAIDQIHKAGIIHRDLKPTNILLEGSTGRLVVVDFGLAFENEDNKTLVMPAGTPLFMSPEQLEGEVVTKTSDQFSLAEITCLMFFGFHPYAEDNLENLTDRILGGQPELPIQKIGNSQIRTVLQRALNKDPTQRFETASEFAEQFLSAGGYRPVQKTGSEKTPGRSLAATGAVITGGLTIVLLLIWATSNGVFKPDQTTQGAKYSGAKYSGAKYSGAKYSGAKNSGANERPGKWMDSERFENFAGQKFRRIVFDGKSIEKWPPDSDYPDTFEDLGWRNMKSDFLIGKFPITQSLYEGILNGQNISDISTTETEPKTNLSLLDATKFCNEMTRRDPDGIIYTPCAVNEWTFAAYGKAILVDKTRTEEWLKYFRSNSGKEFAEKYCQLKDAFGENLEWTNRAKRQVTKLEGVVPFVDRHPLPAERFIEVIGGKNYGLVVHAFDMNFGVNDHLESWSGLKFHTEEDGETCYLHPEKKIKESNLIYTYRVPEIVSARIRPPFSLFSENSEAGIRIRGKRKTGKAALEDCEWKNVVELKGKHFPEKNELLDLTSFVRGYSEVQVQYWIKTNDDRLRYSQIGRTSKALYLLNVGCVEFVTKNNRTSPRQSIMLPASYKSPHIGFRVMGRFPRKQ